MECESAVDEAQEEMLMETTDLECSFATECETSPMFVVGDKFRSYKELEQKIKFFEENNYVQLWKREARTISGVQKRVQRYLNPELRYYQLKYCCVHGGKDFKGDRSTS